MFFRKWNLMNQAGGLGDGASGTGDSGDSGGNGDNNGTGGAGDPPAYVGPEWAKGWEGVEADLLGDPSLQAIQSPASLLKSYVHAQRNLGKKGVIIPTENAPKEEWDQFYAKVGVPLEEAKYNESLKLPAGDENKFGAEAATQFAKLAHELRIAPAQAAKAFEFLNKQVTDGAQKQVEAYSAQVQKELDALQTEWGPEAYGVKIAKAEGFLKEHAGEDFVKYLGQSGLGKNAQLIKAFASMADKVMGEGEIPKGDPTYGLTINDLEREINNIMGDYTGPYYNSAHPDHHRKVDEVLAMNRKLEKARTRG